MKIFLTPMIDESKSPTKNPYISDLIYTLEKNGHEIINKNKFSKIGLFNILFYLRRADAIYFNWIEDLISTRFGFLQTIYVYFSCLLFKLMGKKIIWTLHNRISHSKEDLFIKLINTYFLLNYSNLVITHSSNGQEFAKQFLKDESKNIKFIHHPLFNNISKFQNKVFDKKYDLLIWGAITPYKGVDKFLEYLKEENLLDRYKICIVGKIKDKELSEKVMKFNSEKITIINEFINDQELENYLNLSKVILFTYTPTNTFASGSLMLSLSYGCNIIGPNVGSFKDLADEKLINTFENYDDLINRIFITLNNEFESKDKFIEFIHKNSWEEFGKKFSTYLLKERN